MIAYQIKITEKNRKPVAWRRCQVPAGLTYTRLAEILLAVLEQDQALPFGFEFYHKKVRIQESGAGVFGASTAYTMEDAQTSADELMNTEEWFSFFAGKDGKYRIDIEKQQESVDAESPVVLQIKDAESADAEGARDALNQKLATEFAISKTEANAEANTGANGATQNADEIAQVEKAMKIAETAEKKEEALDAQSAMQEGVVLSTEWILLNQEMNALKNMAKKWHLAPTKEEEADPTKEELAQKLAEIVLQPENMRQNFVTMKDISIHVWEQVLENEGAAAIEREKLEALMPFYWNGYVMLYENGTAAIPAEVKDVYAQINTKEFHHRRAEVIWMLDCLYMHRMIYATVPVSVMVQMYRGREGFEVTPKQFMEIFEAIPADQNPCVIKDDRVIQKDVLHDDLYRKIEQGRRMKDFSIPSAEEVRDCEKHGYPSKNPSYQKLATFFAEQMGLRGAWTQEAVAAVWEMTAMGYSRDEILHELTEMGMEFSMSVKETFGTLYQEVCANTRMFRCSGYTLDEMMKAQAKGIRKIYPNDPCPCGSGKKYKKCCGRLQ